MGSEIYDVVIVGAGPAGATAAINLARKDRRVLLIDRAKFPRPATCSGWVSARVANLLTDSGIKPATLLTEPFRDVTFLSADFTKSTKPVFSEPPGYLVDRMEFDNGLVKAATGHGVEFVQECAVSNVRLKEKSVQLDSTEGRHFEGRLLVIASGRGSELIEAVGLPREPRGVAMMTAQVAAPTPKESAPAAPQVAVILGLDGAGSFAFCCVSKERTSIDVNWMSEPRQAGPVLVQLCRAAHASRIVPVDLSTAAAKATMVRSPAAAALDMDSHVRKHTLLVGDAGGFLSAVSNEGIYPAMWSAKIAAGVIHTALDSRHSQDALMAFDSQWRIEIADHLRSPHTDIRFLLPLIFSNQPMADRMGAAFFFGENI